MANTTQNDKFTRAICRAIQPRIEYVFTMTQIALRCVFKTAPKEAAETKTKQTKLSERALILKTSWTSDATGNSQFIHLL